MIQRRARLLLPLLAVAAVLPASAAPGATATGKSRNAVLTLVPEASAIAPGRPLTLGLHFRLAPGWHTYWKNGGDAGLPARIRWRLPDGFQAGEIQWPLPERVPADPLMSYGYGEEVMLLVELRTPATLPGIPVTLAARVDWLECNDACLPGKAELEIALPVASGAAAPFAAWTEAFKKTRARLPKSAGVRAEATTSGNELLLSVSGIAAPKQAYFYPGKAEVIEHAKEQTLLPSGKAFQLKLVRAIDTQPPATLEGVLEADGQGYEISAAVKPAPKR